MGCLTINSLVGGWPTPLKIDGVKVSSSVGWWHSQLNGTVIIHSCSSHHQAVMNVRVLNGDVMGLPHKMAGLEIDVISLLPILFYIVIIYKDSESFPADSPLQDLLPLIFLFWDMALGDGCSTSQEMIWMSLKPANMETELEPALVFACSFPSLVAGRQSMTTWTAPTSQNQLYYVVILIASPGSWNHV